MKYLFKNQLWALALLVFVFSCSDNGGERPLGKYDTGVLIMNEGAYGANDGEVYHFDPTSGALTADVFERENNRPFAGLLEDIVLEQGRLYLVASSGKVEIVDPADLKSVGAVIGDLDQPRSLATASGKLFISDYGPYDVSYQTPNSYVAVVADLSGGLVTKKISVSNKPEDLYVSGKNVFVAGSEEGKIEVIDADTENVTKTIEVEGNPVLFFEQNGEVWVYSYDSEKVYLLALNPSNPSIKEVKSFDVPNATSKIAWDTDKNIYILTSTGWPEYVDAVAKLSLSGNNVDLAWVTGSGFYGIGYEPNRQEIYVTDSNGFQGNGSVTVYDKEGVQASEMQVGRGPSGFLFR
jgi:YVTN family beta-propeller protein